MAKIFKGDVNFGFVINQTGAQPLDSRSVVQNYEELLKSETFGSAIYNGMTVATVDEQKVYMLIDKTKATVADGWKEVGAGGAVAVDTYDEAVVLATNDNIGQVIFVKTSDETYERAPYIVTGVGTLQKLAASNSDGTGLDADVAKLKETVGDANSGLVKEVSLKVNTYDFDTYRIGINNTLDSKASTTDLTTHTSNGDIHVSVEDKAKWNNAVSNANAYTAEEIAKLATVYDAKGDAAQALADAKADAADKYQVKGDYEVAGTAAGLNAAMDTRMTAVEGDVTALKAIDHDAYKSADEVLQGAIDEVAGDLAVEVTARETLDTTLRGLISAETTARETAIETLQGAIDEVAGDLAVEVTARETLDTTLRGLISAETTARETAISGETSARETLAATLRGEISAAENAAKGHADSLNSLMDGRVAKLEAIDHEELMSNAINAWAQAESNDETVNTFKELVDYAATHKSEFTEIYGEVQGMKTSKADAVALSQEVSDRKAADAELQGAINTEKSARETAIAEVNAEVAKKANQTDLDALKTIVGKASVEGGENGSGLVKRVEELEAIDHDAYKSADEVLQGEINKKANASDLNTEVAAREALAALVGTRAEGDDKDVFTKLAALVAKNDSQDEEIAKKADKTALEALARIVGDKDDKTGVFEVIDELEKYVSDHITDAENAIDKINSTEINGMTISTEGGISIDGTNTYLGLDIERDLGDGVVERVYDTYQTIYEVLSNLSQRIDVLDPNVSGELGITSIMSGNGISVATAGGQATVSAKVVEGNFLKVGTNGLYVEIAVDGNDVE